MFACIHAPGIPLSLREFAYNFSPTVEETRLGTVVIDIDGCELLFGSAYQLANEAARRASAPRTQGGLESTVSVAIAANPDAAIHAATRLKGITFVSKGEELTCLGEFPVEHLDPSLINVEKKLRMRSWRHSSSGAFAPLLILPHCPSLVFRNVWGKSE